DATTVECDGGLELRTGAACLARPRHSGTDTTTSGSRGAGFRRNSSPCGQPAARRAYSHPHARALVGGSSRAEIHARSTRLSTRHPRVLASVPTSHGSRHETVNRRRRHTSRRWYRQSALSPFHGLVQSIPIRDVDQCTSAVERGQGRDVKSFPLGPEQPAQGRLHKLGHCAFLPRGLTLELSHDGVVDIEDRFHMENHINGTVILKWA